MKFKQNCSQRKVSNGYDAKHHIKDIFWKIPKSIGLGYLLYQKISGSSMTAKPNLQAVPSSVPVAHSTPNVPASSKHIPGSLELKVSDFKTKFNTIA